MDRVILFLKKHLKPKKKNSAGQAALEYILIVALMVVMLNLIFSNIRVSFYKTLICFTERRVAPGCPYCKYEGKKQWCDEVQRL